MKRLLLSSAVAVLLAVSGFAQTNKFWSAANEDKTTIEADKATLRQSYPKVFKLFRLNYADFKQQLFSVVGKQSGGRTIISLPNAAGLLEDFEVVEASNFDAALQAKFPDIRSFSGKGITDKYATLKLSVSPQGIQTMIFRTGKDNEFMEPYSKDHSIYSVYTSQREKGKLPWNCTTEDAKMVNDLTDKVTSSGVTGRSGNNLKTLRLAQSVTAEYSNYFGATDSTEVGLVLAAVNNTLTRCNGVYEKDLAVHLNLIANTTRVFYYNPATDPYANAAQGAAGKWNSQLQNTLTSVIGEANYDIGHLFGASGGGGNAGCIGCICVNGSKGSGFTSPADAIPQGDNFDIDYVVHEVGHQLGANHTFSYSNEGTGVNVEIGSGITIMGYAGITSYDVAPHSIDIYHAVSIAQIQANLATKSCPVTTTVPNSTPVVAAVSNYTIPKSTPFALTGSATDADAGDVLTYCWEENDNGTGQTGAKSVASPTKTTGPNWISFLPTTSPTRYFPQLSTILKGDSITGPLPGGDKTVNIEALSSVARTLNFRLTVRDNEVFSATNPVNVAQTNFTDAVVTVSAAAGPFKVTSPNTATSYAGGSSQTITWDVAGTTASPINCANVKISLSTDGGQTFPTVLAASTPNDGSQAVTIPNTASTTARIKIESVGNIFFDISNANFTITSGTSCSAPTGLTASAITATGATVSWTAVSGATSYDVDYKLTSSSTWTSAATATTATSVSISGLTASSTYDWRVRTNCAGGSSTYATAQFATTAASNCATAFEPNDKPAQAATISAGVTNTAAISSATDVDYYKVTIAARSNVVYSLIGPSGVNFDIAIYNTSRNLIGSGTGATATETVSLSNQAAGTYYVKVAGKNKAFSASCYTLTVTATPTGKESSSRTAVEFTKGVTVSTAVSLYPNPVHSDLKVSMGNYTDAVSLIVTDIYGRKVASQTFSGATSVSLNKLSAGTYMVIIRDKTGAIIKQCKVVKE